MRLFCFPHAGGSASTYRGWADALPQGVEVCAIQLPGRDTRNEEPLITRMDELVEALMQELRPELTLPFCCFGHSMGAVIAFELTREWERTHTAPTTALFIAGHRAPGIPSRRGPMRALPEPELIAELRRLGGTPPTILENADLMSFFLRRLRADLALAETHEWLPCAPLNCPIVAFAGRYDSEVPYEDMAAWRPHTTRAFELHVIPGGHFFNAKQQDVLLGALAGHLRALMRAEAAP